MRRVVSPGRSILSVLATAASLGALGLAACGGEDEPAPKMDEAPRAVEAGKEQLTVTHILITFKGAPTSQKSERTKEKAKELATELISEIQGGADFNELLVKKWTADLDRDKKPNTNNGRPGSYTWPTKGMQQMVPEFEKASRALKVGTVTVEPVETTYGFHIIRRDALLPPTE